MGVSLRTCKEKFYGAVHDCLRTWSRAAAEDGWHADDVRFGPKRDDPAASPAKSRNGSPKKAGAKKVEKAPLEELRLDVGSPKLDLGLGFGGSDEARGEVRVDDGGWI
jgi:hypothetical protein